MQHFVPQRLNFRIVQRLLSVDILIIRRVPRNQRSFPQQWQYINQAPLPGKLVDVAEKVCGREAGEGILYPGERRG